MKYVERVLQADENIVFLSRRSYCEFWETHGTTLYNSFPWFVRFRTWPSGIDSSLRQKWPLISLKPGFRSQRGRSDELAKFEAQKFCIPFDASEFQEPDGRLGEYSFKLEIVIGSMKSVKHEHGDREDSDHHRVRFFPTFTNPALFRCRCEFLVQLFLAYVTAQP